MFSLYTESEVWDYCLSSGLISADKPPFLCELLDEIGRKDLTTLVKEYIQKRNSK